MKNLYINGFKTDDRVSSTYLFLKNKIKDLINYDCNYYNFNLDDVKKLVDEERPDIIIANSTGALIAEEFDIPKILIDPVVDKKDLEKLFNLDFSKFPNNKKGNIRKVILGKNDEVLDYKKILKYYKNDDIILVNDSHSLKNKDVIIDELNKMEQYLNGFTFIFD